MCEALDDYEGSVRTGGRLITNFRFADDIIVNAEEEEEAGVLTDRLDRTTTRYKKEIGPDKTKVMTNNPNGFQREIKIKGQRLEEVENFKYLGAIISNEGSKPEILSRIAQTIAALSRLKIIWRDKNISLASKVKLMRTLILSIFLYACESWTLTAEIERRIQALEMRCYRRLLNISYKDHVTNEEVRNRIQNAIRVHDDLLSMVKKRKLKWYGHISRSSGMAKTILQGTVKGARKRERQKKRWEDNIKEWTGMGFGDSLMPAEDREGWKGIVATSSVVPRRPPRLRDWDEMRWVDVEMDVWINVITEKMTTQKLKILDFSKMEAKWFYLARSHDQPNSPTVAPPRYPSWMILVVILEVTETGSHRCLGVWWSTRNWAVITPIRNVTRNWRFTPDPRWRRRFSSEVPREVWANETRFFQLSAIALKKSRQRFDCNTSVYMYFLRL